MQLQKNKNRIKKDSYANIDKVLLVAVLLLIGIGLVMITSAGVMYSQTRFGDQNYFFKHQFLYGFLPGLVVFYIFQRVDYHFWKKLAPMIFLISIVLLLLVFIPGVGTEVYGASRWINLGSISFQPSEMAKVAIILYLAAFFSNKGLRQVQDFKEGLVPFVGILGLMGILILKQPDTGTFGALVLVAIAMYFAAGIRISHMLSLILAGIAGLVLLIKMAPYRMNRFLVFLNPELDPQGAGYQINQALLAIGSGGVFGLGLGHSRQKFNYLPEPIGDSIFAIIGEELGLLGAAVVVILFLIVAHRGFRIAKYAPDIFGKLIAVGITSWIVFQAFINIAAITAIIPLTGIPLPFISYGGTSLIFLMAGVGMLINISKQARL